MILILPNNESLKLHNTCQSDEFYTGEITESLQMLLARVEPKLINNAWTVFTDMVRFQVKFKDSEDNEYLLYVTYDYDDEYSVDTYSEFLCDETNYRIRAL